MTSACTGTGTGTATALSQTAQEYGQKISDAAIQAKDYVADKVAVDPEAGTITWPDGLDMAPEPLYAEARRHVAQESRAAS